MIAAASPESIFEHLAQQTWAVLESSTRLRSSIGEDSITDFLALQIAAANFPHISVRRIDRLQEAKWGFDWEWWIPMRHARWIRFSVQAKKLDTAKNRYVSLRHPVNGRFQIDILEQFAKANRTIPLYCFYNWANVQDFDPFWHCGLPLTRSQLGCTIAPLSVVRPLHTKGNTRSFETLHSDPDVLPWRCLFHHPPFDQNFSHSRPWSPPPYAPRLYRSLPPYLRATDKGPLIVDISESEYKGEYNSFPRWIIILKSLG